MCQPVQCTTCHKITWKGCGQHVASVRSSVPADNWCDGHPGAEADSWFKRLLRR